MARRSIEYQRHDPKYRGSDLKQPGRPLAIDFLSRSGLTGMFIKAVPGFPADQERLLAWADDATDGLYARLRAQASTYHEYFRPPFGNPDVVTFRFTDPTGGSLMFGALRGKAVWVSLAGLLPPPAPASHAIEVPAGWVDDGPVVGWVRAVLKARADDAALEDLLARVIDLTGLRPWAVMSAFSPAWAGYYGHRFRPTADLWRAVREPDIAFIERLVPNLLLHARNPPVEGQQVRIEEIKP